CMAAILLPSFSGSCAQRQAISMRRYILAASQERVVCSFARIPCHAAVCGRVVARVRAHRSVLRWGARAILTAVVGKPIGRVVPSDYTRKPCARLADSRPKVVSAARL